MKHLISIAVLLTLLYIPAWGSDSPARIKLFFSEKHQVIDGFGIAQAGWAGELYQHQKRTEVMDLLYGTDGLRLSILRGEIFPQSPTDTLDDLTKRVGQVWLSRYARDIHKVDKLVFSTWSPPAYMKSNHQISHGFLKPEYYQAFADYLVAFCKAYEEAGLKIYAVSPANEPGYEAPWNSCKWSAAEMGQFLTSNLLPTFKKNCPDVRIMYGENPFWSTAQNELLQTADSEQFVNQIMDRYPEITGNSFIACGHGYDLPESDFFKDKKDMATHISPFTQAMKKGQMVWLTEISSIDALDASMENGLMWAGKFHDFLTKANLNAFIWWGGALPTTNNESLIVLDKDGKDYSLTKRYETFGNYTRYIPVGSQRIHAETQSLPKEVLVSAYIKENEYSTVIVNPTEQAITCRISLDAADVKGILKTYTTTQEKRWNEKTVTAKRKYYTVVLEPKSVTTLVGQVSK